MTRKIIIIPIVLIIVAGFLVYWFLIRENKAEFVLEKVTRGIVVKEISETGTVKISEEINLGFKNAGRIEKIYVKIGDNVAVGQDLAKLDTNQLLVELNEAQADLEVARAKKKDADVSLENARQNLKDVEADAKEDLSQAYEDALDALDDTYLKIYNAFNVVNDIQKTYFTSNDQQSVQVKESRDEIKNALDQAKIYIDDAASGSYEKIDTALLEVKDALSSTREALETVRDIAETPAYQSIVSSSNKTSLDNQKSYIYTANTSVISAQQNISATGIANEKNINSAEAEIFTLETQLEQTGLYPAQINQALAKMSVLENKIQETVLKSPGRGQITKINKREGEMAQSTDSVVSFLTSGPFQVEADIYEEDIVNVKVLNPVKITLAAFPDEDLKGKVVSIDPAEKIIDGVVYYEITIDFEDYKEGIKPGMTADIIIEAERKENVLVIPKAALKKLNGEKIVMVFKDGKTEERKIEIGLEGDGFIEIVSGLIESEEIVISAK